MALSEAFLLACLISLICCSSANSLELFPQKPYFSYTGSVENYLVFKVRNVMVPAVTVPHLLPTFTTWMVEKNLVENTGVVYIFKFVVQGQRELKNSSAAGVLDLWFEQAAFVPQQVRGSRCHHGLYGGSSREPNSEHRAECLTRALLKLHCLLIVNREWPQHRLLHMPEMSSSLVFLPGDATVFLQ